MSSLSLIETEAQHLVGRLPETRRLTLEAALLELCETHWEEVHGGTPPESPLARALWSVTPPLADLYIDLYVAGDSRLDDLLQGHKPSQGLALLVLAEIERGNEEGVHIAHEPMMVIDAATPAAPWLGRTTELLHSGLAAPAMHNHYAHPPLYKALAVIAAYINRLDVPAVLQAIGFMVAQEERNVHLKDTELEKLRAEVLDVGVRFLGMDGDHVLLEQHGHEHKPLRTRQLAEMLLDIRRQWIG